MKTPVRLLLLLTVKLILANTFAISECPAELDGSDPVFLNHQDCNRFYTCSDQVALEMQCPPNLYWNILLRRCDSLCIRSTGTTDDLTYQDNKPHLVPVTTRPDHIECPRNLRNIQPVFFSHEQDCSKYYECVDESVVERHCPRFLFWNQQDKKCDSECIN